MVASRKLGSPFNSGDLDPPSNSEKVQDQIKTVGPHSSKPPIPKHPPSNPNTIDSVTGKKDITKIKNAILRPALTSQYGVTIGVPEALRKFLPNAGGDQEKLNLSCSEAVLPGSNLATMQINNNFKLNLSIFTPFRCCIPLCLINRVCFYFIQIRF